MRWDIETTICAIASGSSGAARGVVRISGPSAIDVVTKLCGIQYPPTEECGSFKAKYSYSKHSETSARRIAATLELPNPIGRLSSSIFMWPTDRSYTGQPSAEIHTLGSIPILETIVECLCQLGARIAEPGEFTLRAFLAGRLDLTQCEAVLGVIHAKTKSGLDIALRQLSGGLTRPLSTIRKSLIELLADLEAGLDFVDDDIEFVSHSQLCQRLADSHRQIAELSNQLTRRRQTGGLPQIAIVGFPNAGKSSLVNTLALRQVAIVSPTAGTTRDFLRVTMHAPTCDVQLVDTAGLEAIRDDSPRGQAQLQTESMVSDADLLLWCIDLSRSPSEIRSQVEMSQLAISSTEIWLVGTKADRSGLSMLASPIAMQNTPLTVDSPSIDDLNKFDQSLAKLGIKDATSVVTGQGIARLQSNIEQWAMARMSEAADALPTTVARCVTCLDAAATSLSRASQVAYERMGDELVASDIRLALDEIGIVAGEVYTDDILDALFSRFCIGK